MTAPARRVWAALLVVYLVWGSTYLAIKVAVETLPPLLSAGGRFGAAALLLASALALRGRSLAAGWTELRGAAVTGGLLLALGVGAVHVAETRIESSVAAMIVGTVPLQVILMRIAAGENPARTTRLSALAGLAGLALVVAPGLGSGSTALGLAVMVGATVSWATGSFLSRSLPLPRDPFVAVVYEMAFGGAFLLAASLAAGEWGGLGREALAADSIAAWAYLVVAGSLVGFTAYAWLLRVAPISLVVTHQFVNPLVAIALGMLLLGERPSPLALAGALLIVAAVYATVRRESPGSPARRAAAPRCPGAGQAADAA
ncbi:MAG TPA: EamA family transporter [Gaiellaceae bacterium]|nr:EamA family transporter [Gaiellaceae bacterium]